VSERLKTVIIAIILYSLSGTANLYSQEADSHMGAEILKIQQDFQTNKLEPVDDLTKEDIPISQDDIMRELMKPGNENLLEQIKQSPKFIEMDEQEKQLLEDQKEKEDLENEKNKLQKQKDEDEEERIRKAKATMQGLLFEDNYAYYESIKDFYGYDLFLKFSGKTNEVGMAANSNYVVGPGDELVLTLWGDTEFQKVLKVSNEGTVFISDVGVLSIHGYKISDLYEKLKVVLSQRYNTISPAKGNPTTFFDISVTKLKSINVFVNGEVVAPGSYALSSYSTILDALQKAKGVTAKGTLRSIVLLRNDKIVNEMDIYDFLMSGKNVNDVNLKDGDNIFVGPRISTVQLNGEVLRPLRYELKKDETIKDLLKFSGGLLATSSIDRVKIERIIPFEERTNPVVTTKIIDVEFTKVEGNSLVIEPIELFNHDQITIFQVPKLLTDYISIDGAVYRKGRYNFKKDMSVKDILTVSGGYLSDAHIERVELIRTLPNSTTELYCLNLKEDGIDFLLSNKDSIYIQSEWNLKSKKLVMISGYINRPGFQYLSENTRVSDLIFSRGGIEDEKHKKHTYMKRADLIRYNDDGLTTRIIPINLEKVFAGDKTEDIFLQDMDHLKIYNITLKFTPAKVRISGYVKKEGEYSLSEKMTVEDLIIYANGFREGADRYNAVVFRMNRKRNENDPISQVHEIELDKNFIENGFLNEPKFFLEDKDLVVVRKHSDYVELKKVTISGEVRKPGVYSLVKKSETFHDLIKRAGGLTSEAFIEGTQLNRDDTVRIVTDFKKALMGSTGSMIVLKDGDDINVPKRPGIVTVEGFVYTPGSIAYQKGWSISDYIKAAGGTIQDYEYIPTSPVIYYPGGNAKIDDGWFFSPEVLDGSKIVVSSVKKEPDTNWAQELRTWLGVMTSALTVIVLIDAVYDK
jgi:protein involved in polysaccharide export with SLBB domain